MTILLIEDEETDFKLAYSILSGEGHDVLGARSAEEAMEILRHDRPNVILTDLQLPQMDGVTFTLQIKGTPETSAIPVIGMTAHPDRFTHTSSRAVGFVNFLVKPVSHRSLPQHVEAAARGES